MEAIVAVFSDWGIGSEGTQQVVLKADRRHFRELTDGAAVLVGRRTLGDFPGGRPLKGRHNIVVTRQDIRIEGAQVVHSTEEALAAAAEHPRCLVIGVCIVPLLAVPPALLIRCLNQMKFPRMITLGMRVTVASRTPAGRNRAVERGAEAADTARICQIYGVSKASEINAKQHWQRRPCLITIGTRTFACSLYGVPHNPEGNTIKDNDMNGQTCLHFTNSRTHDSDKVDSYHTEAIQYAWEHAPNGHK